jgi:hypothetical protein
MLEPQDKANLESPIMAASAEIDTSRLRCQDVFVSSRGAKQIPVTHQDGSAVHWQPRGQPLACLWQPSAYNDDAATRVNISFAPSAEMVQQLKQFDDWATATLAGESARLLGGPLDHDEIKRRYQPALRVHEKTGSVSFKCKMNTSGRSAVKCWDTFCKLRPIPEDWTACAVTPRVALKGFWVMGKELGPLFELQHVQLDEAQQACPF